MAVRFLWFSAVALLSSLLVGLGADCGEAPAARTVTLQNAPLPLSKALAEVEKKTGIHVEDRRGEGDPDVRLDLKDVPFWQALDRIADAVKARVYILPRERRISLVKRSGTEKAPVCYSGPFRISLKRITISRDLESGSEHTTAAMEVCWEPQLQPFFLATRPQNLVVKDDSGKEAAVNAQGNSLAAVDGQIGLLFDVTLPSLPRSAKHFGLLEGKLSTIGPSKMLEFNFETLDQLFQAAPGAAVRQKQQDGITCRISKVTLTSDHWTIQVTIDTPPGYKLDSYQSWVVNNEMVLESKEGQKQLPASDYVLESASDRRAVLSYNFRDKEKQVRGKAQDWKVRYTTPASVVEIPLTFRFKDVPLP